MGEFMRGLPSREAESPKGIFLGALNEELAAMERSGKISPAEAEEKRGAAAMIEAGFSDNPRHDALLFSRTGIAGEEEILNILKKGDPEKS